MRPVALARSEAVADRGADGCDEASDEPFEYGRVRLGDHVSQRGLGGAGECRGALDVARVTGCQGAQRKEPRLGGALRFGGEGSGSER
jgi:hypothetical protein